MYKGLYTAATGAALKLMEVDMVANNAANVNTNGYKRTSFASRLYPLMEGLASNNKAVYPDARGMAYFGVYSVDSSMGTFTTTGDPLDLAVNGEGYFAVQKDQQTFFTRNGDFRVDSEGFLLANGGHRVLGTDDKPIKIGKTNGTPPNVAADGTITVDGAPVGKVKIVGVKNIRPVSESLLSGTPTGPMNTEVQQGVIERSNINPVREMIGMVTAMREFETIQKVMRSFDELAQKAVTEIARV